MDPQIEYATAADRVRIATWALGEGRPLLIAATPPWSHVLAEYAIPPMRAWIDALAEDARVVRYDNRGSGLSDRAVVDFSVEAQVRDMEAVADHYALDSFAIWGAIGGSPASIVYAARHPDRVSHLLLWGAYAHSGAVLRRPGASALGVLLRENWELYTDTYAQAAFGWPDSDVAAQYAQLMRDSLTQDALATALRQMDAIDVSDSARAVRVPALVLARRDARYAGIDDAKELTALIPAARLLVLDGTSPAPFLGDTAPVIAAVRECMASGTPPRASKPLAAPLTHRETEVLRLLANGGTGKEIAAALGISLPTVQRHVSNIYAKIGARGRVEAANYAFEQGLVRPRRA